MVVAVGTTVGLAARVAVGNTLVGGAVGLGASIVAGTSGLGSGEATSDWWGVEPEHAANRAISTPASVVRNSFDCI